MGLATDMAADVTLVFLNTSAAEFAESITHKPKDAEEETITVIRGDVIQVPRIIGNKSVREYVCEIWCASSVSVTPDSEFVFSGRSWSVDWDSAGRADDNYGLMRVPLVSRVRDRIHGEGHYEAT